MFIQHDAQQIKPGLIFVTVCVYTKHYTLTIIKLFVCTKWCYSLGGTSSLTLDAKVLAIFNWYDRIMHKDRITSHGLFWSV